MELTVVILGHTHSGTTMLAGILQCLGIPMVGERYRKNRLEDLDIFDAFEDEEEFKELVENRNARHAVWGMKKPGAYLHPESLRHVRNPLYMMILKSPVSVSRRRFGECGRRQVKSTLEQMLRDVEGLKEASLQNVHFLAYHDAIADPCGFVRQVAGLVGMEPDEETVSRIAANIKPNTSGDPYKGYPRMLVNHA